MDGLGPALFGLFVVSFTVSKPVRTLHFFILISQPHRSLIISILRGLLQHLHPFFAFINKHFNINIFYQTFSYSLSLSMAMYGIYVHIYY